MDCWVRGRGAPFGASPTKKTSFVLEHRRVSGSISAGRRTAHIPAARHCAKPGTFSDKGGDIRRY